MNISASAIIASIAILILPLLPPSALTPFAVNGEPKEKLDGEPFTSFGDVMYIGMPIAAGVYSLAIRDYDGAKSLTFAAGTAILTTWGLKYAVGRPRPYQEADERGASFPSGHATTTFVGAAYLQRRYGWYAGIPAYALAAATGYSRVWSNYHYWSDVAAGAAIGTAAAYIFTKPYNKDNREQNINVSVGATMSSASVIVSGRF